MRSSSFVSVPSFLAVSFVVIVLFAGTCSAAGLMDSPWPQYRCDSRHTGQCEYGFSYSEIFFGEIAWSVNLGDRVRSSPAIGSSGTIYVGSDDDRLYAITPGGDILWSFETGDDVVSSPALAYDGTVYVGSMDDHLYAIRPNGQLRWKYDTGSEVITSPSIGPDGTIYVGSKDGTWHALDPDGDLRWSLETGGYLTHASVPIGDDGTVYMVEEDGHWLYAMDADGNELRRTVIPGIIRGSPAVAKDGTVYVITFGGMYWSSVYAVGPDGDVAWTFNTTGLINSALAVDDRGMLYFGTSDEFFYALDPDGTVAWHHEDAQNFTQSAPAIAADGTIFVGQREGCLVAIMETSCHYDFYSNDSVWSSPAIGEDNTVYFGSNDGHLYAFAIPGYDPEPTSVTMEAEGPSLMFIVAIVIIIVVLSVVAGVFGLNYRGSGGWRADGQVLPHTIMEDPTWKVPDNRGIYHPADWERRPPGGPPP